MSQQTSASAPVRVKEEMEDETAVVVTQNCARINAFIEAQQISVKQEPQIESHPLPVPSTSSSLSSSHLIKREFNDKISSVFAGELPLMNEEDEKDELRQWVRVVDPGTPAYLPPEWEDEEPQANLNVHLTQSEANHSTITTDHLTAQPYSAQIIDPLPVNEPELQQTSRRSARQTTAVNYRNTDVDTDSSDAESANSDDQHENAQLNNPAASAPTRQSRKRPLSPETNDTTDSHKRTKPKSTSYRCTVPGCARVYQTRCGYNQHQAFHSGSFICEQCGKSCPTNTVLKRHQLKHSGTKPYQCTECSRAFAHKSTLTSHLRIHSGEKPYQCTYCEKAFTTSSHLTEHLRVHTHDHPYKCTYCSYASAQKTNLTTHLRRHTDTLPFQCEQCSKRFNQKGQLTSHMRNKH